MAQAQKKSAQEEKEARGVEKIGKISLSSTSLTLKEVVATLTNKEKMRKATIEHGMYDYPVQAQKDFLLSQIALALSQSERKDMLDFYKVTVNEDNYGGRGRQNYDGIKNNIIMGSLKKIGENKYSTTVYNSTHSPSCTYYNLHFTVNDNNTLTITAFSKIKEVKFER